MARDSAAALEWFRRAAEGGFDMAQYNLGMFYKDGRRVPKDLAAAVTWYRKAAAQGHAKAQYSLGAMYGNGQGVAKDYVEAYFWFDLAAANFKENEAAYRALAIEQRDKVAARISPAQRVAALVRIRNWRPE